MHPKDAAGIANNVDPDQPDLGLHCLPRPICPKIGSLRQPQNALSDQGVLCLHTGISIKNQRKTKKYTRHPLNEKRTYPIKKDGGIHQAIKGGNFVNVWEQHVALC